MTSLLEAKRYLLNYRDFKSILMYSYTLGRKNNWIFPHRFIPLIYLYRYFFMEIQHELAEDDI